DHLFGLRAGRVGPRPVEVRQRHAEQSRSDGAEEVPSGQGASVCGHGGSPSQWFSRNSLVFSRVHSTSSRPRCGDLLSFTYFRHVWRSSSVGNRLNVQRYSSTIRLLSSAMSLTICATRPFGDAIFCCTAG